MADFKAIPKICSPQFGGFCAYGVAEGHKATTTPYAFTVVDDNFTYLNYNKDVRELWKKDRKGFIKKAHKN